MPQAKCLRCIGLGFSRELRTPQSEDYTKMAKTYTVCWEIDLVADSPAAAARMALETQRDHCSYATHFTVDGISYDADDDEAANAEQDETDAVRMSGDPDDEPDDGPLLRSAADLSWLRDVWVATLPETIQAVLVTWDYGAQSKPLKVEGWLNFDPDYDETPDFVWVPADLEGDVAQAERGFGS